MPSFQPQPKPVILKVQPPTEQSFYAALHAALGGDDVCPVPTNLDGLNDLLRGTKSRFHARIVAGPLEGIPRDRLFAILDIFAENHLSIDIRPNPTQKRASADHGN